MHREDVAEGHDVYKQPQEVRGSHGNVGGSMNGRGQGPEVGLCQPCADTSKAASVAGAEWGRARGGGEKEDPRERTGGRVEHGSGKPWKAQA